MARTGKKTYYWDSCTLIAWVDGGKGHPPQVIAGLDEIAGEVTDNKAILCTSVIIETELLRGKLTQEQALKLQGLFKRRNVLLINLDSRIARRASEIRNYYNERNVKISSPDSIHLATAIIYGVDEFHTLDGGGERPRPNDLLRLNGNVAGYSLHIRMPVAVQSSLFTGVIENPNDRRPSGKESEKETTESSPTGIQRSSDRLAEGETTKTEGVTKENGRKESST